MNNKIIIILGPTASGKSSVAIRLARQFNGEVISADSRQIYRGMDIGSGKISRDKSLNKKSSQLLTTNYKLQANFISEKIPHYMIDIISPRTEFNVAKFKKRAQKHIEDILKRGKIPIICGGTGFWIQSIVEDTVYPQVKPDWKLREKLNKLSLEKLLIQLKKIDPQRAKTVDTKNKIRLIRALEICQTLGQVPTQSKKTNKQYKFLQIGILRDKETLSQRIKLNVEKRFKKGMVAEVRKLHADGLSWKKIESFGLSYRLVPQYLKGEIKNKEELLEKIYLAEKNYAKRQRTWFKKDTNIKWLKEYSDIKKETKKFLK